MARKKGSKHNQKYDGYPLSDFHYFAKKTPLSSLIRSLGRFSNSPAPCWPAPKDRVARDAARLFLTSGAVERLVSDNLSSKHHGEIEADSGTQTVM